MISAAPNLMVLTKERTERNLTRTMKLTMKLTTKHPNSNPTRMTLLLMRKKRGMNVRMKKVTEYPYNNENDPNNEKKNEKKNENENENEKQPEDDSNIRT